MKYLVLFRTLEQGLVTQVHRILLNSIFNFVGPNQEALEKSPIKNTPTALHDLFQKI